MEKAQFKGFIEKVLLPMYTGTELGNEFASTPRQELVAEKSGALSLYLKPHRADSYRFEIKRHQPFSKTDKEFISKILEEIVPLYKSNSSDIADYLVSFGVEKAICKYLAASGAPIFSQILAKLTEWSARTYEGKDVSMGIVIDLNSTGSGNTSISDVLSHDFSALISDGVETCLLVDRDGAIREHKNLKSSAENVFVPLKFQGIAELTEATSVAIVLTRNGDILMIKDKKLMFAKRRNIWHYYNHDAILKQIAGGSRKTSEPIRKAIYASALDVAFSRTGGTIAYVRSSAMKQLQGGVVKESDIPSLRQSVKSSALNDLIGNKLFHEIPRSFRKELLGIDGALLVDTRGMFFAIGAIIQIGPGSTGGGRLAATKTLAAYGTAIKISSDGMIQGFKQNPRTSSDTPIFAFG